MKVILIQCMHITVYINFIGHLHFFMSLDKNERAFVIASINARVEQEEEESKKVGKVR